MTTPINPEGLKARRAQKKLTQEQLAARARVSWPTIKRIERSKNGLYQANKRVAELLSKALGVDVDDLAKAPVQEGDHEEAARKLGYRNLRMMIDAETALAFNMVEHLYGIPVRSQVVMSPLFAALLAEGSLAWRQKRVDAIAEAADNLMSLGGGNFSFANSAYRAQAGVVAEEESISRRDLFGTHASDHAYDLGYDPSERNPFADYLAAFAEEVEAKMVDVLEEIDASDMPRYRIGADIIGRLTDGDPDAEYALGRLRIDDIPEELLGDDKKDERIAWMIARIPEEVLAARKSGREKLQAFLKTLPDPDLGLEEDGGKIPARHGDQ